MPERIHIVAVNDHIVCASPSERVTHVVMRTCEIIGNRFPAYDDGTGRPRRGIAEPYITGGSQEFQVLPFVVNYHVNRPLRATRLFDKDVSPFVWEDHVFSTKVTHTVTDALAELSRAIRENLRISI